MKTRMSPHGVWLSMVGAVVLLATSMPSAQSAALGLSTHSLQEFVEGPCQVVDVPTSSVVGGMSCNPAGSGTTGDSSLFDHGEELVPCIEVPVVDMCEAWVGAYDDPDSQTERPMGGIAVSPGGHLIFQAGTTWPHPCEFDPEAYLCGDVVTVAYDADGQRVWEARYAGAANNHEQGNDVVVSPDGSLVYVAGLQDYVAGDAGSAVVIAYDAATGSQVWTARYDHPATRGYATAWAIAVSPDGEEVYVAGATRDFGDYDYLTVAYNAVPPEQPGDPGLGEKLWEGRYAGPRGHADIAWDAVVSPDGNRVYVNGSSYGTDAGTTPAGCCHESDYLTVAYRAGSPDGLGGPDPGTEVWVARFDPAGGRDEPSGGIAVSPDGTLIIVTGISSTGSIGGSPSVPVQQIMWGTVAYRADTGAEVWRRAYGGESATARDLAFSPKGDRVFVVGAVGDAPLVGRFGIVAYDTATGTPLWDATYGHQPGTESQALAVAVSPDGKTVYVSEEALMPFPRVSASLATIAYDAADGIPRWVARYDAPFTYSLDNGDTSETLFASADGMRLYVSATSWTVDENLSEWSHHMLLAYDVT